MFDIALNDFLLSYGTLMVHKWYMLVFYRSIREDISGAKAAMSDTIPCPT